MFEEEASEGRTWLLCVGWRKYQRKGIRRKIKGNEIRVSFLRILNVAHSYRKIVLILPYISFRLFVILFYP